MEPKYSLGQRALAETLGTALLVLVGPGSVVATLVLAGDAKPAITGSDLLGISFAFGFIITALVYALGKVSGCHINPAVTFALAATKRFPWRELPTYWAAQVVGAVHRRARRSGRCSPRPASTSGMGQTSFNEATTTWGLGDLRRGHRHVHADAGDPRDRRRALARRLRRPRHRRRRGRDHHGRRPGHRRVAEPGPRVRPGVRLRARRRRHALGPALPVYILPGLVGSALAAFVYDFLADPAHRRARRSRPPSPTPTPAARRDAARQ